MLGQQFATILARTDPFDVAQGLERYIRTLSAAEIRTSISEAAQHMNAGYRAEFLPLLEERDDERLRAAFAHSLKSNLRAIPLFGPGFCQGVISMVPGDRTVGLGQEDNSAMRLRPVAFGIIALVLLIAGAAAEHVISKARANADAPVVLVTPAPAASAPAVAVRTTAPPETPPAATPRPATPRPATPRPATPKPAATPRPPTPLPPTPAAQIRVAKAAPVAPAPIVARTPRPVLAHRAAPRPRRTPPVGHGVKTVVAGPLIPTPTPEPTSPDLSDMPASYSDATPLPRSVTPAPAQVPTRIVVATPTPGPNRSWTHRLVHAAVHLVNSTLTTVGVAKKPQEPTPSPSPSGPKP